MSETDELRRMLDERGVEWGNVRNDGSESDYLTEWQFDGNEGMVVATEWAVGSGLSVEIHRYHLTPEQAIAATLGQEDTYTREDVDGAFVRGYSLGSLPIGSDPRWDENRQTVDEHMAELGWVRKEAATLGRGECKVVSYTTDGLMSDDPKRFFHLSCGHWVGLPGLTDVPKFCPECGLAVRR